ncbi:MAG: DUF5715 family protein [Silvibacterium sp.]
MRYLHSAVSLVLAFGLVGSPAAWASIRHHRHHTYSAKTKERKVQAHHGNTVPSGSLAAHKALKRHQAMNAHTHHVAERRIRQRSRIHLETEKRDVAVTIPPIPMRDGHLYMPPPLVGSLASLQRQNTRDEAEGLKRIQNDAQLNLMRRNGQLVPLPVSMRLRVSPDLPLDRRCTRPWTAKFLLDTARAHYVRFHRPLQINSAVRTVQFQRRLVRVNGNAAPATGAIASPHLMGATIDIAKKGLSLSEIAWMRAYLLPLQEAGKLDVEEEFYQSCFHITVYESYASGTRPTTRRSRRHTSEALLASRMR